jgi:RNA polymerase sigma-70 factor, ECF subfamily
MQQGQLSSGKDGNVAPSAYAPEFATIAQTNHPQIFRFLLASLRDVDLAESLTQECFLKAYRNWPAFRGQSSVRTWLMRIAINLQRDHWRSKRAEFWREIRTKSVDVSEAGDWLVSDAMTPEAHLVLREQLEQVWKAVERLRERQRTVLLLRYVDELEYSEIARATGLHEGTVKAHLSRALSKVRQELGKGTLD